MTHLTQLQCSMYADGELPADEMKLVDAHASDCTDCSAQLQAFALERQVVAAVLQVPEVVTVPKFKRPARLREFAMANIATGVIAVLVPMFWKLIYGSLLDEAFARVLSMLLPDEYSVLIDTLLLSLEEGTAMIGIYLDYVFWIVAVLACVWGAISLKNRIRSFTALASLVCCLVLGLGTPSEVQALDLRKDEKSFTVGKDEVITDTLIVNADSVVINGTVDGDLILATERLVVNGVITGNLFVASDSATLSGRVDGSVFLFGSTVDVLGGEVVRDLWLAGETVTLNDAATVGGNATIGSERVTVAGQIGRDLTTFTEHVDLAGRVGQNFKAYAASVALLDGSSVAGDVLYFVEDEPDLEQAPGATVGGEVMTESFGVEVEPNRYLRGEFYLYQVLRFVSALILGMLLLWFIPGVRYVELEGGASGVMTGVFGLVAFIALPVMTTLLAVTVIGIPLAAIALFTWLSLMYFAKIVLAIVVGQMLLGEPEEGESYFKTLLVGLAVILVLVNLPVAGGILNVLLASVGAGLIVKMLLDYVSELSYEPEN